MPLAAPIYQGIRLAGMLFREWLSKPVLERHPEEATMEDPDCVEGFHRAGVEYLMPVYHFNALAVSRLAPMGGTVVDLGSGSGQFLVYLAQRRPDLRIIGLDLSEAMVDTGLRHIREMGLEDRVSLSLGDMTNFIPLLTEPVALVSSVFALHHLPLKEHLRKCLGEIAASRARFGSAVWLFDHVRPFHPNTPKVFPEILTPNASPAFRRDSTNSLIASWSYQELTTEIVEVGLTQASHSCARVMKLYQTHWLSHRGEVMGGHDNWEDDHVSLKVKQTFESLRWLLPESPV